MKAVKLQSDRRHSSSSNSSKDETYSFEKSADGSQPSPHSIASTQGKLAADLKSLLHGGQQDQTRGKAQAQKLSSSRAPSSQPKEERIVTSPRRRPKLRIPRNKSRSQTPSPKKTIKTKKVPAPRRPQRKTDLTKGSEGKGDIDSERPLPATPCSPEDLKTISGGSVKKTDQISYGNLDVCLDEVAKTPSDNARRLMGARPKSSGLKKRKTAIGMRLPETIDEISDIPSEESSSHEQDRDLSEKSFDTSMLPGFKKDAQVQTPTKEVGMDFIARKQTLGSRRHREANPTSSEERNVPDVTVSTESEEIVELHHIDSSSGDSSNPLGRMRKRFHQFLDDAFNVMGELEKTFTYSS